MTRLDAPIRFLFDTLSLGGEPQASIELDDEQWRELLEFADRTQTTLLMVPKPGRCLPVWVLCERAARASRNADRITRVWAAYKEIAAALAAESIDFVVLKGFTHLGFCDYTSRVQYDLDLYPAPAQLEPAMHILEELGYRLHGEHSLSDQHIPPMVRPNAFQWRGDYFDPDIPISIDLHTALWNEATDRIALGGVSEFWARRGELWHHASFVPALHRADRVAFAAMHAVRHILRNDAKPASVFELASFLHNSAQDHRFWVEWSQLYDRDLMRIQAVAFRFAVEWFGCELSTPAAEAVADLPRPVRIWFDEFGWSPVENLVRPNKDVVWLHMALLHSTSDRLNVLLRRLFPVRSAAPRGLELMSRARYHGSAIVPALASGLRWWRRSTVS